MIDVILWTAFIIIVALISFYIFLNYVNMSNETRLVNLQESSCNQLFDIVNTVCYSLTETTEYYNFPVTPYFNNLSVVNGNTLICSYLNINPYRTFECNIEINSTIPIEYYKSGLYYSLYHNLGYEIFNLKIEKLNSTDILITLIPPG